MRITPIVAILFFLCGVGVFAESNPPSPTPPKTGNPHQNLAASKQEPPKSKPKFFMTTSSPNCSPPQIQTSNSTGNTNNKPPTDWIPWLTGLLVIIGGIQAGTYISQLLHFRRTERPYIFVTVEIVKDKSVFSENGTNKLFVVTHFKNHGKTPAILKDIKVSAEIQRNTPPNKLLKQEIETQKIPDGFVVGSGGEHTYNNIVEVSAQDWGGVQQYTIWLTCFGVVRYMDTVSKSVRETGFCWHYYPFPNQRRFFITSNDGWNYYT